MRKWLKEIRENANLSQSAMAELTNLRQSAFSMIETGERNPSVTTAKKIAEILGFNWTRFFENESAKIVT